MANTETDLTLELRVETEAPELPLQVRFLGFLHRLLLLNSEELLTMREGHEVDTSPNWGLRKVESGSLSLG